MSRPSITNFFPNTNITALQALEWKILLTRYVICSLANHDLILSFLPSDFPHTDQSTHRIGEAAMYHLLLNTNIFIALPHNCFCQLVGTPITELKPHTGGFLQVGPIPDAMVATALPAKRMAEEDRRPKKRGRLDKLDTAVSQDAIVANVGQDHPEGQRRSGVKSVSSWLFAAYVRYLHLCRRTPADIPFVRARMFYARLTMAKDPDSSRRRIVVGLPPHR